MSKIFGSQWDTNRTRKDQTDPSMDSLIRGLF